MGTPVRSQAAAALWFCAAVLAAMVLPTVIGLLVDGRQLRGISLWDKPLKFQLSLGLHLLTLIVAVRMLEDAPTPQRSTTPQYLAALAVSLCALLEAFYIQLQAARGRESHFNRQTTWETVLYYGGMGTGALVILAGTAVIGWILWRRARVGPGSGLRYGMALGLLWGSAATLVAVVPLSSGMIDGLGHWVGGVKSDAHGLPIAGWSTTGGDLRVPHFFATHLIQALPAAGWIADRLDPGRARTWVRLAAGLGLAAVAATLIEAASGRPLIAS